MVKFVAERSTTHLYLQSFSNTITWKLYKLPQEITELQEKTKENSDLINTSVKDISCEVTDNNVVIKSTQNNDSFKDVEIPSVTREQAGVLSAFDKKKIDDITGYEELVSVLEEFNMNAGETNLQEPKFVTGKKYRFVIKCTSGRIDNSEKLKLTYFPGDRFIWEHQVNEDTDKIGIEYTVDFEFPVEATIYLRSAWVSVWSLQVYEVINHESSVAQIKDYKSDDIELIENIKYNQPSDLELEISGKYYNKTDAEGGVPTGTDENWGISKKYDIPEGCNYLYGDCGLHYTNVVMAVFDESEKLIQLIQNEVNEFDSRIQTFKGELVEGAKKYALQYNISSIQDYFNINFCAIKTLTIGEQVDKNRENIIAPTLYSVLVRSLRILCIGDSLTDGDHGGGLKLYHTTYPYYLHKYMGWNVTNAGASGATAKSYVNEKYTQIDFRKDYDVIVIMLGTNAGLTDTIEEDTASGNFETYADTNTGYYCRLIEMIYKDSPRSQIFLCVPPPFHGEGAYVGSVASTLVVVPKIAEKYNLPVIDVYHNLGINSKNYKLYQPIDGLHLNSKGYDRLAQLIGNEITSKLSIQIETINEF